MCKPHKAFENQEWLLRHLDGDEQAAFIQSWHEDARLQEEIDALNLKVAKLKVKVKELKGRQSKEILNVRHPLREKARATLLRQKAKEVVDKYGVELTPTCVAALSCLGK